jgi:hypothetical protein
MMEAMANFEILLHDAKNCLYYMLLKIFLVEARTHQLCAASFLLLSGKLKKIFETNPSCSSEFATQSKWEVCCCMWRW